MNNYCSVAELFVMFETQYKILACGTICTNKKGWDQSFMNLSKRSEKGASNIYYKMD